MTRDPAPSGPDVGAGDVDPRVRVARAHLSRVVEPGDAALGDAVAEHGWQGVVDQLDAGRGPQRWRARHTGLSTSTPSLLTAVSRLGIRVVVPGDPEWPVGVDDLEPAELGPVACLWVRGSLPAHGGTQRRGIAVVGARACSAYGEHTAMEVSADLVEHGWPVVSGAAYGIDAAAHRGALVGARQTEGVVATVAVLACGVDRVYPSGHAGLLDAIVAAGGGVVSELAPGASPHRWRFLQRNRVIAAMTVATVVVEAAARSGAANTARVAALLSRAVAAVPGPITSATSAGCHDLIRDGVASLVCSAAEVVQLAGAMGEGWWGLPAEPGHGDGSADTARVASYITATTARTTAQIALATGLDVDHVRALLLDLEITGVAARRDGGWVRGGV